MKRLTKNWVIGVLCAWSLCAQAWGADTNRFVATLSDGQKLSFSLPANEKPALPLRLLNTAGTNKVKYDKDDIQSIELSDKSITIDGCHRWEVKRIATPSLVLGIRHIEKRLVGVLKSEPTGTVYRWIVAQKTGGDDQQVHYGLWIGVEPNGSDIVYPFIQDHKVWFRDLKMVLGRVTPDFVKAVNAYYVKGSSSEVENRQDDLMRNPTLILQVK